MVIPMPGAKHMLERRGRTHLPEGWLPGQAPDADGEDNFAFNEWNAVAPYT
jgi:hypothetical protein